MPGGYGTVVTGTTIDPDAHNEYVRDQVISRFASTGARDSAITAPEEGMFAVVTATDTLYVYDGSAWQRLRHYSSTGRVGGTWTRATNLSCNNATFTDVTFTAETSDSDGFLTPTSATATVPSGLGGLYAYDLSFTWASSPGTAGVVAFKGAAVWHGIQSAYTSSNITGISGTILLAAADTFKFQVIQNSGGAINLNPATFNLYRIAI
jgi:hypothetical protein